MKTTSLKFLLAIALGLFSLLAAPAPLAAQTCMEIAALTISAEKSSYQVGESITGEVAFTNNTIFAAVVDFTASATRDGQVIINNSYAVQANSGRNSWTILQAFGSNTLPSPGTYVLSVAASYPALDCTWNANLTLTATSPAPVAPPQIQQLIPDSRLPGEQVIIQGSNFTPTGNDIKSGTTIVASNLPSAGGDTIVFTVPDASPGPYPVSVSNSRGTSNEKTLIVLGASHIDSLNPSSATFGSTVTISGSGFTATGNNIKSGSVVIGLNVSSPDGRILTFTVPDVSPGQYPVSVQNQRGTSNEVSFTVLPPPPQRLLTSLTISPQEYLLGETVTGSVSVNNPSSRPVTASFRIELYKGPPAGPGVLVWSRDVDRVSVAPGTHQFSLDDVFGFKPTIPDDPFFVGDWLMIIRNKDFPADTVSKTFSIKAPFIPPLSLSFNFDPKEYQLSDTLKGKGTVTNPGPSPVIADFKIELFQGSALKWQREIKDISVPSGTADFTVDDLFGSKVVIPNEVSLIGDWKLKLSQIEAVPPVNVEAGFKIQSPTAACKPTTGTPESGIFGIIKGWFPWNTEPRHLDAMKELGVRWTRLEIRWDYVERQRGQFDWSFYDAVMRNFDENNIKVLGSLHGVPCWANGRACQQPGIDENYPPNDLNDWANFVRSAVNRYKPGGKITLKNPVIHWEIWNEPNIDVFWRPQPDARAYTNLLAVSNKAIREVDPKAIIGTAGFAGIPQDFVDELYKQGAKNCFDTINFHPYGPVEQLQPKTEAIKRYLANHNDANKPIWYTEYGFVTGKPGEPGPVGPKVSEQEQAQYVKETYDLFKQGIINNLFWISLVDLEAGEGGGDFGLLRHDFSKKPAFDVLKNLLKGITPSPGISINVDAAKTGRDIAKLKKGYNYIDVGPNEQGHPFYTLKTYEKEIGHNGALLRFHNGWSFASGKDGKQNIKTLLDNILKEGNPEILFDVFGMPQDLSLRPDAPPRFGCLQSWATYPPKDYGLWKKYVKEWVEFLKPYHNSIKYWEIGNEPENSENNLPGCFWSGTEQEFFNLYKATVEGIKEGYGGSIPAGVKIGGPALLYYAGKIMGGQDPLYISLPRFAKQNNLPLDFFSWHNYNEFLSVLRDELSISKVRAEVIKYFPNTELIIDEFDLARRDNRYTALLGADFGFMARQGLDRQAMFRNIDDDPSVPETLFKYSGMFGMVENLITKPAFNLFKAINKLGDAMISVDSQPSATADYVLATKSSDKVSVMIVNFQDARVSDLKLTIKNVPTSFTHYTKYIIDATHSNAYAVEARIKTRMAEGKSEALTSAKEVFSAALQDRGWNIFKRFLAQRYLDEYLANPDDPDVKAWFNSLSFEEQSDVAYAFSQAMNKYNEIVSAVADEINNWPEVKLYSETKTVAISPNGTYNETITLEPYAVQFITLSK